MAKKKYTWWIRYPGQFYANTMSFKKPVTEETARKEARSWLGVKRLPPGTELWGGDY